MKIKDGMVAVLYSPGYGAGWTTWNSDELKEFLFFDKTLVEMAEREASKEEAAAYINEKLGADNDVYMGGWPCQVEWMKVGTRFRVEEYDGSESLRYRDDDVWEVAG